MPPSRPSTMILRRSLLTLLGLAATLGVAGAGCTNVRPTAEPFAVGGPPPPPNPLANRVAEVGYGINDAIANFTRLYWGEPPAVHARRMLDADAEPEVRRQAITDLVRSDFAQQPPYTEAYAVIAASDPDPLVRAAAVRAVNVSGALPQRGAIIERLTDEAPPVRLEAAKALGNLPDPAAAQPLLSVALDEQEDLDVRIAAIEALRHYESLDLVRGLGRLVEGREFSLAWQSRRTLIDIVGQDHRYDARAYLAAMAE